MRLVHHLARPELVQRWIQDPPIAVWLCELLSALFSASEASHHPRDRWCRISELLMQVYLGRCDVGQFVDFYQGNEQLPGKKMDSG